MTSSSCVRETIRAMLAGQHVVAVGPADALAIHRGVQASFREQVHRICGPRDVIVMVNPLADALTVLHGADLWSPPRGVDTLVAVGELLTHRGLCVLVIIFSGEFPLQDPDLHDEEDRLRVAALQQGMAGATTNGPLRNACVIFSSVADGIPEEVRRGVAAVRVVEIGGVATPAERRVVLTERIVEQQGAADLDGDDRSRLLDELVRRTEGMTLGDIDALMRFGVATHHPTTKPARLIRRFQAAQSADPWADVDLHGLVRGLQSVKGQDDAIAAVTLALAGHVVGLDLSGNSEAAARPPAYAALLGPTGVGKTKLAQEVAKYLFGDDAEPVTIDCSTYKQPHDVQRLIGSPPSFVGYGEHGQLTGPALTGSYGVMLIDEFEKAAPQAHDYFMRAIDQGQVMDGSGRTADFSNWVILATSNLGSRHLREQAAGRHSAHTTPTPDLSSLSPGEVRATVERDFHDFFASIDRPEIAGRWAGNLVVFQPLRDESILPITASILSGIRFTRGPALDVDVEAAADWMRKALTDPVARQYGGRFIRNGIRSAFRRLAAWAVLSKNADASVLRVIFDPDGGMHVSVDNRPTVMVDHANVLDLIRQIDRREEGGGHAAA